MGPNLYTQQDRNVAKTWFLMIFFLIFIIMIGWVFSYVYNDVAILYFAVIFSLILNFVSYFKSDKIALAVSKAKPADEQQYRELYRITENLCMSAGIKMPRLYIIDDPAPNAFATGRNQNHSAVAVTTGLLAIMDRVELEGVIAHELAHIGNKDILLQTIVVVLVGIITLLADFFLRSTLYGRRSNREGGQMQLLMLFIGIGLSILSPIIATIIQLAISRKREFLADATGALITRYPEGLASALEKISNYAGGIKAKNHATAHLFIANPLGGDRDGNGIPDYKEGKKRSFLDRIFSTHPPVEDRIAALRGKK
ncbi:MAG TPA: M48 family metallopeptidase [Candidatus Paceibacterota bacterium]|nr:M48 family metallopeptidase [Candidatus Paceibacterota bacterium]HMP19262.1 M48 family metallopeptidase [Candidatus Paceibacterota bacterium]